MSSEGRKVLEAAMALPREERAALVQELLASLSDGEREPGVEEAWAAEITHRAERFHAGETTGIPWQEAKARIIERFGP